MSSYRYRGALVSSQEQATILWLKYIDAFGWAPGELDHQEFAAFSKAAFYGIEQEFAFSTVVEKMKLCGARNLRLSKIRHSLARAYASGGDGHSRSAPPLKLPPIDAYDEGKLAGTVGELADKVDEAFFIERSPFTTWNRTPAGALHKLSLPGEYLWVTADAHSVDGCLWSHQDSNSCSPRWVDVSGQPGGPAKFDPNFDCLSFLADGQSNVWFLPNPVDGQAFHHERFTYGHSYRCLEAVTCWRHLVMETDLAPAALWLALLAMLPLKIAAVYHSGGRGYHALCRIDAASKLAADDLCEVYKRAYAPLGACKSALSAFRLSRLPNCHRGQTGQWQRLIYLCDKPTGTPIKDQPALRKVLTQG